MLSDELLDKLVHLCEPIVIKNQCELYHLEFVKESGNRILRLYIDKDEGVSLNDCEKVSRDISDMLDMEDPINESYNLEVSSPGIDRILYEEKHLKKYIGKNILIKLSESLNGKKKVNGQLISFNNETINIMDGQKEIPVPRDKILIVSLKGEL
ncbi:ribosome maturation factor RimP [Clostridium sp. JN-9]|uniref:ribosome maturation factor RimP n=1 Tax=Clostridium sp. JN-9 TaxID=2507159 RepID=UPI000FFE25E3|nr:ribosome maturation factor RimP [Clostridium sp. JN-9]QAT40200.1 ribosome maturation factor RimP [Clostridium sp. JN-9]